METIVINLLADRTLSTG